MLNKLLTIKGIMSLLKMENIKDKDIEEIQNKKKEIINTLNEMQLLIKRFINKIK